MPSYADEFAARHPELQIDRGPVRLTISRGDDMIGPDGQYSYAEEWEQVEIMDVEVVNSIDSEPLLQSRKPQDTLTDTIRERFDLVHWQKGLLLKEFSLLVLDTNVLLSTLPFLMTLVSQCLGRNVFYLSNAGFSSSSLAIVIPHIVLSELDNLKTSSKGNVAPKARAANNWILSALQSQKKQMYDEVQQDGSIIRKRIPESSWVLHVENTDHASALGAGYLPSILTPDEEIVRLCAALKKDTGLEVFFCSDDTNARTRAEIEGLSTMSFRPMVEGVGDNKLALVKIANELIEQWKDQIQGPLEEVSQVEKMEEDEPMILSSQEALSSSSSNNNIIRKRKDLASATLQESIHAARDSASTKSSSSGRPTASSNRTKSGYPSRDHGPFTRSSTKHNHQYPNDRSTASSMWAN